MSSAQVQNNAIRLPPTEIDFINDVGITGQAHDNYPKEGQQPRYDWMRMFLIGLLSCQSSINPPTQYRKGTPWLNANDDCYYWWNGTAWSSLAEAIVLDENSNSKTTLQDWFNTSKTSYPRCVFGGYSTISATKIPIPIVIQNTISGIINLMSATVFINGSRIDFKDVSLSLAYVELTGVILSPGDKFQIVLESFNTIVSEDVVV